MFARALRGIVALAVRIYYRLEVSGAPPTRGPLLLCGNHPNGLLDPMLLMTVWRGPLRFLAKAPVFQLPVLGAMIRALRAVPVYRAQDGADTKANAATFDAVVAALVERGSVCIYPEGVSHSVPRVLPLKTGAARIALQAQRVLFNGELVRLVPIGVNYLAKHRFRSRALLRFGAPIDVRPFLERPEDEQVRALTEHLHAALAEVCWELDRADDLPLLQRVDALLEAEQGGPGRLASAFPRWQRILVGYEAQRERAPAQLAALRRALESFFSRLDALGLRADRLDAPFELASAARFFLLRGVPLLLTAPLAAAGTIAFFVPWRAPGIVTRALQPGLDMQSTYQLLTGAVLVPLTWVGWTALAGALLGLGAGLLVGASLPVLGLAALVWNEEARGALLDARIALRLFGEEELRRELLAERRRLVAALQGLGADE